ncbi:hypothetical protein H6F43_03160 [Leptolyngbya sp. FACHB-36]|uniref:hypothetical protein n=1 Tax=Leptolyngbya sp. FACHB-36 TaxID=2692808 RepID=UPI001680D339|nr:hypothetical protein [Leptolyngbya sp. FACHB-36]MBD2019182.1 hypothetical protein [Leptolyngbya sp. FACHB-36]
MNPSQFDLDFQTLLASFSAISQLKGQLQQQFVLNRVAAFHGLPRAEFRRLYSIWLMEQTGGRSNG